MTSTLRTVIAFVVGAVVALAGIWAAHETGLMHGERAIARKLQKAAEILPLEQIHAKALEAKPGRVVETDFEVKGDRFTYEVDILDAQGVFWEVEINAKTGELVRMKEEHDD